MKSRLKALKAAANEVIEAIDFDKWTGGAVNCADLRCVEASECKSDEGREWLEVLIEEASPDCTELQSLVRDHLIERGFGEVTVRTEW